MDTNGTNGTHPHKHHRRHHGSAGGGFKGFEKHGEAFEKEEHFREKHGGGGHGKMMKGESSKDVYMKGERKGFSKKSGMHHEDGRGAGGGIREVEGFKEKFSKKWKAEGMEGGGSKEGGGGKEWEAWGAEKHVKMGMKAGKAGGGHHRGGHKPHKKGG